MFGRSGGHPSSLAVRVGGVDDNAFYTDLELQLTGSGRQSELTGTVTSTEACGGPWSPELQHGGPPNALLVLVAERLAGAAAGRTDLVAVRTAAEFLGPMPVTDLQISARVSRLSGNAVLVEAKLGTSERSCLQARVWLLAPGPAPAPQAPKFDPTTLPPFHFDAPGFERFGYARQLDWRLVSGSPFVPGPAAAWIRPISLLVAGDQLSGLQRAALLADSASGISAELSWDDWSFANVDLDLHLFRIGTGDWLLVDAVTRLGAGVALTRSRLADLAGDVGAGLQTLLVRPR
jgi:hypothetical protein